MRGDPADRAATIRWAGTGVAVASWSLIVTIVLYAAVHGPAVASDPAAGVTIADRAAHVLESWALVKALWIAEATLFVLLAISALLLVAESAGGSGWLPRPAAWAAVAVGALLQTAMYAFMLGGYPAAIDVVATSPALFRALNDAAFFLFYAGNATIFFGFAAAYASEAATGAVVSKRLGWIASAVCLLTLAVLLAVAAGRASLLAAAPLALVTHLLMGYLGLAHRRREGRLAAAPGRPTTDRE